MRFSSLEDEISSESGIRPVHYQNCIAPGFSPRFLKRKITPNSILFLNKINNLEVFDWLL